METEVVPGGPAALAERAAVWLADEIWAAVTARRVAHVAVSGGSTPTVMFEVLAGLPVPWDRVHVWQVDERVAPDGDPDRNASTLDAVLLSKVGATPHLFDVTNPDLDAATAAYAAAIRTECDGVFDVVHLGVGPDGHTASWPPGDPVIDVTDSDAARCREFNGYVRLTLTVPAVNRARAVMFEIAGPDKAPVVVKLVEGRTGFPASRVRREGTLVLLDETAAADLPPN